VSRRPAAPQPIPPLGGPVLGIDIGTSLGWALLLPSGDRLDSGVWDLSPSKLEGGGWRLLRLRKHLNALLDVHDVTAGAFERVDRLPRPVGAMAAHVHGELRGVIRMVFEERRIPHRGFAIGEIKKGATGRGNASKDEMIDAAEARWGVQIAVDDEADALWVAELVRIEVYGGALP
jgi:Holliday junction resolvasome RuvABC endonuclease subunit